MEINPPLLKPLLPVALALLAIFDLTGCLEESTVVKIGRDTITIFQLIVDHYYFTQPRKDH